jgi:hypothetical protein
MSIMKKFFKALLVLTAVVALCTITTPAKAAEEHGTCGDNLTWTISDGVLNITGEGDMTFTDVIPWRGYDVTELHVGEGITSISSDAFECLYGLKTIDLPKSITKIGDHAFKYTTYYDNESNWENGLLYIGEYLVAAKDVSGEVTIKQGTKVIADYVFLQCHELTKINLPDELEVIGELAFADCTSLKSITLPKNIKYIGAVALGNHFEDQGNGISRIINDQDFTVYGYSGGRAETYADEYGLNFASIGSVNEQHIHEWKEQYKGASYVRYTCRSCGKEKYVELDFTYGDVNGDGEVNMKDYMMLARYVLGRSGAENINLTAADVNGDGEVTMRDYMIIANHVLERTGYETLPIM